MLLFSCSGQAQEYIANVQQFGIKEGLSHREVNVIFQDSRGFIWLGTPFGLNRFDGSEFRWWTKEKNGLPDNDISGLIEDAEGDLWISSDGNDNGLFTVRTLCFLNIYSGKLRSVAEKFGDRLPAPLGEIGNYWVADSAKTIFFGTTRRAKMLAWHPDTGFRVFPLTGYQSFRIAGISADNTIWGVADKQVWLELSREGKIRQAYRDSFELTHKKYFLDGTRVIYEASKDGQPLRFRAVGREQGFRPLASGDFQIPVDSLHRILRALHFNPFSRNLWVFGKKFLSIVHPEKGPLLNFFEQHPELNQDASFGFRALANDAAGRVWLGGDFGVYKIKIRESRFKRYLYGVSDYPSPATVSSRVIAKISCRSIFQRDNFLFVSTERDGVQIFDLRSPGPPKPVKTVQVIPPPDLNKSYALIEDRENNLWIGEHRLHCYDPASGRLRVIKNEQTKEDLTVIWALYEDGNRNIWLGRGTGLQFLDRAKDVVAPFEQYNGFDELSRARITYIGEDREGVVWVCANTGLYTLDIKKGIAARYWPGGSSGYYLPQDKIQHIYQDSAGIYWLGTAGGGLVRWDKAGGRFRQFTRVDGLPNNNIYAVYEDKRQHLWMSSDYGIIQFDKLTFQSKTYLPQDGTTHIEFNRCSHFQSTDGRIWFGGLNGVTAFQPDDFYETSANRYAPLQITGFQQFDGSTDRLVDKTGELLQTQRIVLRPGDRFFQLAFALLSYEDVDQIRYAYKMEGVDADWVYQRERSIRISGLPYGKHTLKIRGQAADGRWSENVLELQVSVLKPFYFQTWFLLLLGIALAGLAVGFYKWRTWQYKQNQIRLEQEVAVQTATIRRQAETLRALDQTKSRFYANISHEFRTPLTIIKGLSAEIKEDEQIKTLIHRNADNLLRLINQLLDLSKLENGSLQLDLEQDDIVPYLHYLTESFYSMAEEKKIRLSFHSEIPELVMDFDEEKMQYIVYNLLTNAIKFTPPGSGGKVDFHTRLIRDAGQPVLQLTIQDNGIGMPPEELPHVFDRFYQAPRQKTSKERAKNTVSPGMPGEGTGIGLTLSKELIELMGGNISAVSEPGQGTCFSIRLPVTNNAPSVRGNHTGTADIHVSTEPVDDSNKHAVLQTFEPERPLLLIIEDNRDVVAYMIRLLQHDYRIETAPDGRTGIEKAFALVPDLIISDVMMPEKDGYEVCETLKNDERSSHIPIILLTAKATESDKIEGLKTGADAYLMKPFNKEELFVRLEKLQELRRNLQKRYAGAVFAAVKTEPSREDVFIQKIREVIEANIDVPELGITQLCAAVHLGHTQVFRKMKALTGENPTVFIRHVRLQKALTLLRGTDRSVSEIAYDVGFTDPNYFSRVFSEMFGMAPSAARKG
ncbi:MAG: response regulator [Saprospiraceae bacterium]|nr:response regulator [Saprospiraceae bacterium]